VPEYIDLGPADGWRYLRLFSPRRLPLQVRSYMLYHLRLFSPLRLPLQTLRTLHASQADGWRYLCLFSPVGVALDLEDPLGANGLTPVREVEELPRAVLEVSLPLAHHGLMPQLRVRAAHSLTIRLGLYV
jgi:hypothetical protein